MLIDLLVKRNGLQVILLVDEYDAPLNDSYRQNSYDEASQLAGTFYTRTLKGAKGRYKSCLMGIIKVRGAGILSGLNNLVEYSVVSDLHAEHFGFTLEECMQLVPKLGWIIH